MIGQKLQENIQSKINKILTDFVIEYRKDDNEERIDALHNQTVLKDHHQRLFPICYR